MGLSTRLVVGGAVVGVALTYHVRRRRARTGESYLAIIRGLPGDVLRWTDEARDRAALALDEGVTAARRRDAEFGRQLLVAGEPPGA